MVRASLKANRSIIHGWERVGLAKIVPTKKRLSMSYGVRLSSPSAADLEYINPRLASLLPSSYHPPLYPSGSKLFLDFTHVLSGLESSSKRTHNIENELLSGLKALFKWPNLPPMFSTEKA